MRTSLRIGLFAALPLIGLLELGGHLVTRTRAPELPEYAALAAPLAALRQPSDVVVVAPRWAEPMARRALGDGPFPLADLARSDLARYPAAIEVSVLGEEDPELAEWDTLEERSIAGFDIRRKVNPEPREVVYDFVEHVRPPDLGVRFTDPDATCHFNPRARVAAGGLGGHPTFPRERFECPGSVFFNVSVTVIADERFLPRRCIWAHPPANGALVLRWDRVPLGETLEGHSGMYWIIERTRQGAPVELEARVGGEVIGTTVHSDGEGWKPFSFDLGAHAETTSDVELAVRTTDHRHRHFCFEATSR